MLHCINWHDLDFDRFPIPFRSTRGVPQTHWVKFGMPRIPHNVIRSVFYLYRSREDAQAGKDPGGTGFIVRYDGWFGNPRPPGPCFYGVTNWHVACRAGCSVVRLNARGSGTDIIEFGPEDWHFLPGKYDVAVVPLTLDEAKHDASYVSTNLFAPMVQGHYGREISIGEDAFMMGLFVDHDGVTTNVPGARFGNISMLPNPSAPILQPTGFRGEAYVIDMHSRGGFSGSPVFVYRTFGSDLTDRGVEFDNLVITNLDQVLRAQGRASMRGRLESNTLFNLLGIHWGQFPEEWEITEGAKSEEARHKLKVDGAYVQGLSGMTLVVPAWHIREVLDMPKLAEARPPRRPPQLRRRASVPTPESVPPPNDANPKHREDFNSLLDAAVQKPEPKD